MPRKFFFVALGGAPCTPCIPGYAYGGAVIVFHKLCRIARSSGAHKTDSAMDSTGSVKKQRNSEDMGNLFPPVPSQYMTDACPQSSPHSRQQAAASQVCPMHAVMSRVRSCVEKHRCRSHLSRVGYDLHFYERSSRALSS